MRAGTTREDSIVHSDGALIEMDNGGDSLWHRSRSSPEDDRFLAPPGKTGCDCTADL